MDTPISTSSAADGTSTPHLDSAQLLHTRQLFWHNVVREMLGGLSVLWQQQPEIFDGRFAVLTHAGERISIGQIFPLFACSIPGSSWEREASTAVQCTVFRIATPEGEVFTLPLHEIRGIHSLTPELMQRLAESEKSEDDSDGKGGDSKPFGLAAFAALPKPGPKEGPTDQAAI